jgi:hypothetical protein
MIISPRERREERQVSLPNALHLAAGFRMY